MAVVGLVEPGDERAADRLRQLGVRRVLPADAEPDDDRAGAAGGGGRRAGGRPRRSPTRGRRCRRWACRTTPEERPAGRGRVVAVWGPTGAPGRTTVAVGRGRRGCPARGVVAAGRRRRVRRRDRAGPRAARRVARAGRRGPARGDGKLDAAGPGPAGLGGAAAPARADRSLAGRPVAGAAAARRSRRCWRSARRLAAVTVVDCGFSLEDDEELSFDTAAPRRNGATLAVLEAADTVLCVSGADPVALQRSIRALGELRDVLPDVEPVLVVNQVRRGTGARRPAAGDRRRRSSASPAARCGSSCRPTGGPPTPLWRRAGRSPRWPPDPRCGWSCGRSPPRWPMSRCPRAGDGACAVTPGRMTVEPARCAADPGAP